MCVCITCVLACVCACVCVYVRASLPACQPACLSVSANVCLRVSTVSARTLTHRHSVHFVSTVPSVWSYCDLIGVTRTDLEHLEIRPSSRSRYAVSVVAKMSRHLRLYDQSRVDVKFTVVSLSKIDRCQSIKNRPLSVCQKSRTPSRDCPKNYTQQRSSQKFKQL